MSKLANVLLPLAATAGLGAQTFIVDAANGPGTHFTNLTIAVASVPDGSVLVVRAGGYGPFGIQGKALTVLGEPGAVVTTQTGFSVANIQPHQAVTIRGLELQSHFGGLGLMRHQLTDNQGPVWIDSVAATVGTQRAIITRCAAVVIRNCGYSGPNELTASDVVFQNCSLQGLQIGIPSVVQQGGRTQLADSTVVGTPYGTGSNTGIQLMGGDVRLLRGAQVVSSNQFQSARLAIDGSGTVRRDPAATIAGGTPAVAPGVQVMAIAMPHLTVTQTPIGSPVQTQLDGPSGAIAFLAVGLRGQGGYAPGIADRVFWEAATVATQAVGVVQPGAPLTGTLTVPAVPAFTGLPLVWHGLTFDATNGGQVSAPGTYVAH